MQLMTSRLERRFREVGAQRLRDNPLVIAKYFDPTGSATWYATEYDTSTQTFFGYVSIFNDHCDEWGYFALQDLEGIRCLYGLGIERDLYCGEKRISEFYLESNPLRYV